MAISQRSGLGWFAACVLLLLSSFAAAQTITPIFADNFDSSPVGSFPSGWSVYTIGATGSNYSSVSAPNLLPLDGVWGLGAVLYHSLGLSPTAQQFPLRHG